VSEDAAVETRWRVPLSDIIVEDELADAVLGTLRSSWWSMRRASTSSSARSPSSVARRMRSPWRTEPLPLILRCSRSAADRACAMDDVRAIANRHGLAIVEDAAHAPGASLEGHMCGTLGDVGCFSFLSNKNLPLGGGGMIVTSDDDLAERLRLLRWHGMTTLTWDRNQGHASSYDVLLPGFNSPLTRFARP
jgi:hypothetical protein